MELGELTWTAIGTFFLIVIGLSEPQSWVEWWHYVLVCFWPTYFIVDGLLSAYLEEHHAPLGIIWRTLTPEKR